MIPAYNAAYQSQALGYLLAQFNNSPVLQGIINAWSAQMQTLETATQAALMGHNLATAYGSALDDIGTLVGQPRNGLPDAVYQQTLVLAIAINHSDGSTLAIYNILKLALALQTNAGEGIVRDYPPAYFVASISNPTNVPALIIALNKAKPAGVAYSLEYWDTPDSDMFVLSDDYNPSSSGHGFDDYYSGSYPSYFSDLRPGGSP